VVFLFFFLCACAAEAQPLSAPGEIPVLFSDHHADHGPWLLDQAGNERAALVVVDAHADTAPNNAGGFSGNHNWIHPLVSRPVDSLVWISGISGFPAAARYEGFVRSTAGWNIQKPRCVSLDELGTVSPGNSLLFVSIDLDFFYQDTLTPRDIPFVFDRLLEFSLRWPGNTVWAVCVSSAWLPNSEYAWEVLEQSLAWLSSKTEFAVPVLTLFSSSLRDSSRRARYFRSLGLEAPGLYQKADAAPERIRLLLEQLAGPRE
jgi:hypothetical protein